LGVWVGAIAGALMHLPPAAVCTLALFTCGSNFAIAAITGLVDTKR
jgi:hypothetical protein